MDEIKKISSDELNEVAAKQGFGIDIIHKDFYLTIILYLIKEVQGIYFKGGTALQKIFLNYSRLSEDADFTITRETKEVIIEITTILEKSKIFTKITKDKDVEGFIRLVVHYNDFSNKERTVFLDLNRRANLLLKPETNQIKHFYKGIFPDFSLNTLAKEEMISEKVAAAISRNKPRDHYDLYRIIKAGIQINMKMAAMKCKQSKVEFNITKMFNNAQKLKRRWDEDLLPLLAEEVSFEEVMTTLAKYFRYSEVKEKLRTLKKSKNHL